MSQTNLLKLLEAGILLLALGVFVWWQMRDLKHARQATERQRAIEAAQAAASDPLDLSAPSTPPRSPPSR